jgi:glucosylceramidase
VQTDPALSQSMAAQPGLTTSSTPPQGVAETVDVNEQLRYQQFRGLGAAMTDSSAYVFNAMPAADRATLIQNLFGQPDTASPTPPIHLNFLRVGIGATGAMTVGPAYSYDDNPPGGTDPTLGHFGLTTDDTSYIIPTLQQVLQTNPNLEILANPWSPPAWMKSNDSLGNSNHAGDLLSQYYQTYADYFVKFIQAYTQAGIPIDAITPANEPTSGSGGTGYPGLNSPEADEAQFIANNLKPALDRAGLHPAIYGNDLSWDRYAGYASPLASDANAGPDLTGIAWHCYFGSPTVMSQLEQTNPTDDQIVDECSPEIRGFGTPEFLISTLRNWASVVAAWSVALEPDGQPIQTPNSCGGCRGLVSVDPSTGAVTYRPEYYQFGQVSAFVQPGARRIDSPNFVTYGTNGSNIETISSGLDDVAFINPDGSKVLVAYNNSSAAISFAVASDGSYFSYAIPAGAMTTFVWH